MNGYLTQVLKREHKQNRCKSSTYTAYFLQDYACFNIILAVFIQSEFMRW